MEVHGIWGWPGGVRGPLGGNKRGVINAQVMSILLPFVSKSFMRMMSGNNASTMMLRRLSISQSNTPFTPPLRSGRRI